jgi:poly(3-hydroxyalkanoate) depolymerase
MAKSKFTSQMVTVDGREVRMAHWSPLRSPSRRPASGATQHRPLLFFNGIGANLELISPMAEMMADRDIITFDMPGIGGSPDPVWPYRPWMMARVANQILDDLGFIGDVDVMGISWGGAMAQQFALQYQKRTHKLVLVATTAGMLMVPGKWSALSKMIDPRRYTDPDFMLKNFQTLYGGAKTSASGKSKTGHTARISPPSSAGYFHQIFAMFGWTSAPFLPFLSAKTLILMGDDDNIVRPVNGQILKMLIPNARMETIKGGGHLFLLTHSEETIPLIEDFLEDGKRPLAKAA